MSEEIPELGETAYVGYFKASHGKSLVSGLPLPAWDEQAPEIRQAWNLAAMAAVDRWRIDGDERLPDDVPQPAKVIVVTEIPIGDRMPVERRYDANQADYNDYGPMRVLRKGHEVAAYQPNAWLSVREEGALVPDSTVYALSYAMRALRDIANTVLEKSDERREVVGIARDAIEQIEDGE